MRAIIIAAGDGTRWGEYLGIPKHLVQIDNEPILYRTIRLLKENNVDDIVVVGPNDSRYKTQHSTLYTPIKNSLYADADKFLSSESLWSLSSKTITLFGDVFFTNNAIKTIVETERNTWTVFGRSKASKITGGPYGEIFAHLFTPDDIPKHKESLNILVEAVKKKDAKKGSGWEHYKVMQGIRGRNIRRSKVVLDDDFIEIDDWTEDFDFPKDYDNFIKRWNSKGNS
jgi:hypothetical protein